MYPLVWSSIILILAGFLIRHFQVTVPDLTDLKAILLWIATGPGAAYVVGRVVSTALENVVWWHMRSSNFKFVAMIVIAFALPIIAHFALK